MNILVSGMLWSGSSAVIDMLKEYKSIGVLEYCLVNLMNLEDLE